VETAVGVRTPPPSGRCYSRGMEQPRTKLVCTIGPASADRVRELIEAGMNVARINFSHGTPDEQRAAIQAVRAAAREARKTVAVLVDLPGAKIRLGEMENDRAELETGAGFTLRPPTDDAAAESPDDAAAGTSAAATVSRPDLADMLQVGDRVLLADGNAELRVTGTQDRDVLTEVVRGGEVRSRSGVNVPSERLTEPGLTDEDRAAVPRALELRADLIAQSFVRSAADVEALRALLPVDGPPIVVKIETRQAVDNFDEIVAACQGVMVARGDLGVDLPFEEVPMIQKRLLETARKHGAFTIVATQMLESMTSSARPTRAEVSDVANAVLDGTDAVMLSGETAIGAFPVESAAAMTAICAATERDGAQDLPTDAVPPPAEHPDAIVHATHALTEAYPRAKAIWCFTRTGRTAQMLSVLRPKLPIVAFTPGPVPARRLTVRNAVVPIVLGTARTGEPLIRRMEQAARAQGLVPRESPTSVVLVTTTPEPGGVNRLELHEVNEKARGRRGPTA
jgi:pyruvate kinase